MPVGPLGLAFIQAKFSSKERGDGLVPSFQGQVVCRLASHVLLLDAGVASAKENGGELTDSGPQASGPDSSLLLGLLGPHPKLPMRGHHDPALKGSSTLSPSDGLCDLTRPMPVPTEGSHSLHNPQPGGFKGGSIFIVL